MNTKVLLLAVSVGITIGLTLALAIVMIDTDSKLTDWAFNTIVGLIALFWLPCFIDDLKSKRAKRTKAANLEK